MKTFGFIGAGKMAGAIVRGIIASGKFEPSQIACACGDDDTGKKLSQETSVELAESLDALFSDTQAIVAACKPQQLKDVAKVGANAKSKMLISILAGTSIARLRECFPNVGKIVRVMPNMPAQISMGISCYAPESPLSDDEKRIVDATLSAIGEYIEVEENQLDAVTALSGSGPGYIFEFAAAMIEGAKTLGFSEADAKKLVEKTMTGSAMLLEKSELSADELRTAVSSPGGTTLAALDVFAKSGFRDTVKNALIAARNRSQELSKL